jgi:AcrR family transcriptional regulator
MTQRKVPVASRETGHAPAEDPRPLRRDAEVNLSRILAAARDVFAEQGYDASMEAIAARAEVGIGTLYRRFPNKADLLNAVVEAARERNRRIAEDVLAEVPPGEAVFEFVRRCIAAPSCWRATISTAPWRSSGTGLEQMAPLLRELIDRSRRAGTIRPDVEVSDLVVLLMSVRSIADICDTKSTKPSRRFLELLLDGLRPGHPPVAHDPLTIPQLDRVLRRP